MTTLNRVKYYLSVGGLCLLGAPLGQAAYVGPTENITKVANAISARSKSLTTVVNIPPGLSLTQPVTISIGFYSPAGANRITQTYTGAGMRFLHNDAAGDGKSRPMHMDISLSEPKPGGRGFSYGMPRRVVELVPLYRVAIGPLLFGLFSACDSVGNNEIELSWRSPDKKEYEVGFRIPPGGKHLIKEFSWSAAEISASKKAALPSLAFSESDSNVPDFFRLVKVCGVATDCPDWVFKGDGALVPGKSRVVKNTLSEKRKQCTGYYEYQFQSDLLAYPNL